MHRSITLTLAAALLGGCVADDGNGSSSTQQVSSAVDISSANNSSIDTTPISSSSQPVQASSSSANAGLVFPAGNKDRGRVYYTNSYNGQNLQCTTCHGANGGGPVATITPRKPSYAHSDAPNSSMPLAEYIYRYMPDINSPGKCDEQCAADIAAYINSWGQVSSTSPDLVYKGSICEDRITYAARQMKLLTRAEYQNSVEDLLGIDFDIAKDLPNDTDIHGYSNNLGASVTEVHVDSFLIAAEAAAEWSRANGYPGIVNCAGASGEACATKFLDSFVKRAFRRPATKLETTAFKSLFDEGFTDGDVNNGLEMAITAALTSPAFLYRSEQGEPIVKSEYDGSQYSFAGTPTKISANDFTDKRHYVPGTQAGAVIIGDTTNKQTAKLGRHLNFTGDGTLISVTLRAVTDSSNSAIPILRGRVKTIRFELPIDWEDFKTVTFYLPGIQGHTEFAFEKAWNSQQVEVLDFTYGEATLDPNAPDKDAYALTPYEVATYLAYTFTGSTPDQELMDAADANALATDAQIAAQVSRLIDTPRAKKHLGDFATQWLGTDKTLTEAKDPAKYPELTPAIREAMVQEVREFFAHVMLNDSLTIDSFFAADFTFANKTLADYYGLSGATGNQFIKVSAGANRGGILTTGAFMTTYGNNDETSPIRRAGAVRERLLCHDIPPPPPGVVIDREAAAKALAEKWEAGELTNRERYHELTKEGSCQACHKEIINPLGFGMEDFDTIGRYQTTDRNGLTVDASGQLIGLSHVSDGGLIPFYGAKDLSNSLATLDQAKVCFAQNLFRFALGMDDKEIDENNDDLGHLTEQEIADYSCSIDDITAAMIAADNNPKELLKQMGALKLMRYRKELNR